MQPSPTAEPTPDPITCPRCGRVESFIDGIGEEFRPH